MDEIIETFKNRWSAALQGLKKMWNYITGPLDRFAKKQFVAPYKEGTFPEAAKALVRFNEYFLNEENRQPILEGVVPLNINDFDPEKEKETVLNAEEYITRCRENKHTPFGKGGQNASLYFEGDTSKATVLVIPGNLDSALHAMKVAKKQYPGHPVLAIQPNFACEGEAAEKRTMQNLVADAKKGESFLKSLGVPSENTIICGFSLGCVAASQLAKECEKEQQPVKALVLNSPFSSLEDVVKTEIKAIAYTLKGQLLKLLPYKRYLKEIEESDFANNEETVSSLNNTPILIQQVKDDPKTLPFMQDKVRAKGKGAILLQHPCLDAEKKKEERREDHVFQGAYPEGYIEEFITLSQGFQEMLHALSEAYVAQHNDSNVESVKPVLSNILNDLMKELMVFDLDAVVRGQAEMEKDTAQQQQIIQDRLAHLQKVIQQIANDAQKLATSLPDNVSLKDLQVHLQKEPKNSFSNSIKEIIQNTNPSGENVFKAMTTSPEPAPSSKQTEKVSNRRESKRTVSNT